MRGRNLRRARALNNLTQREVADALGVSQGTVSNWELGRAAPTRAEAMRLRQYFAGLDAASAAPSPPVPEPAAPSFSGTFGEWVVNQRLKKRWTQARLAQRAGLSQTAISNIENGRSPNPLASTRQRIEKALGVVTPVSVTDKQERTALVQGVGVLRDFEPHDPATHPREPGVYVFYDRSDRPIYVGETTNIASRVKSHTEKFWFKEPIVDTASYVAIADDTLRRQVEAVLIAFLRSNAVLNVRGVRGGQSR